MTSILSCVPFVHSIVVVSQKGHACCVLDWVSSHAELEVGDSKVSDYFVHKDVVCGDIPHASQLHRSRGVSELEGFESSTYPIGKLEDSDISNLSAACFAGLLFVV